MPKTFYITTPIYYPSGKPHIGTCYTNVVCDMLARWHKLHGEEVFFTTGTDEHGQKVENYAKDAKMPTKAYVDSMVPPFKELLEAYDISYHKFVRTTDAKHKKFCQNIIQKIHDKGDIYKGKYEGWYCEGCETYYTEKDLVKGKCPTHKKKCNWMEEETYFFKMSKYQKKVEDYLKKQNYIFPKSRQNFILKRMKEGVKDLSISRSKLQWGIPLPFDKKHVMYVWGDAIWNYRSSTETKKWQAFWPANVHVTSHDIMWHHSVIWLSLLFAAGVKPPKQLLVHGFIKGPDGHKMSKSLGNVVDPMALLKTYPADSIRYFLLREIPLGMDGSFSYEALHSRHNDELVNDLGNLHARTLSMVEKYCNGKIPTASKNELVKKFNFKKIKELMDKYETHLALSEIWKFINEANRYINDSKPWELAKNNKKKLDIVLYNLIEALRVVSIVLSPFIPESSKKIQTSLGVRKQNFKDVKFGLIKNKKIKKEGHLFSRVEEKIVEKKMETNEHIDFDDWLKVKMKVGKIVEVKKHEKADKLYILKVDLGSEKRQIVSGLVEHYKESELKRRQVIVITNLKPRKIRGVESQGMLLVAEHKKKVSLLQPDDEVTLGSEIC